MALPVGSIIMWFRPTGEIPNGWVLCNGNNGTPDLRGKFVIGVGADGDRVVTGNAKHAHTNSSTVAGGAHVHDITGSIAGTVTSQGISDVGSGNTGISPTHSHVVDLDYPTSGTHQHTTSNTVEKDNLPPYVQVYYIMRIL
jgi:microcystin-dependent protein